MIYTLRDYQRDACRGVWRSLEVGIGGEAPFDAVLALIGTGGGKTICGSALMEKWRERGLRSLFLADSDELCLQAVDKLRKATGIIADMDKAKSFANPRASVVVGSIQTMSGKARLERFPPGHFKRVICDEAQASMADNWQTFLNYHRPAGSKFLGLTATPSRGDGQDLLDWWQHIAAEIPMKVLIEARHLTPVTVRTVPLEIPITGEITEGDQVAIGEAMRAFHDRIIDSIERYAADRKSILVFHPSCAASEAFTRRLMERGHAAQHVEGGTKRRAEIIAGFERGDFRFLNNAQLLMRGFDSSPIDCVIPLRPTGLRGPYIQMVGRGTRLYCPHGCSEWCDHDDRKKDMLLLDFLWQAVDHVIMGPAYLHTDNPEQAEKVAKILHEPGVRDLTKLDARVLGEREEQFMSALKRAATQGRGFILDARALGAVFHQPELMDFKPIAPWQFAPATEKQLAALARFKVDIATVKGKGHASALLDALMNRADKNLATIPQLAILADRGIKAPIDLTYEAAHAMISRKKSA